MPLSYYIKTIDEKRVQLDAGRGLSMGIKGGSDAGRGPSMGITGGSDISKEIIKHVHEKQ